MIRRLRTIAVFSAKLLAAATMLASPPGCSSARDNGAGTGDGTSANGNASGNGSPGTSTSTGDPGSSTSAGNATSSTSAGNANSSTSAANSSTSAGKANSSTSAGNANSSSSSGGDSSGSSSSRGQSASSSSSGGSANPGSAGSHGTVTDAGTSNGATGQPEGGSATSSTGGATAEDASGSSSGVFVRQWQQIAESGDNNESVAVTLPQPLAAGSTLVAFTSEPNFNGNPSGSGTPNPVTVSDSAGNSYTVLNVTNDSPQGILQANQSFACSNVAATSQPVTVTASFTNNQWLALVVIEVAGVGASPVLTAVGNFVDDTSTTASSDSTPTMSLSGPTLILALGADQAVALVAPAPGAGFTTLGPVWNWGGAEGTCDCPSALLEYAAFANPGNIAATFTPASSGANLMNLAVAIGY